jgi:hypothetical protein
MIEVLQSAKEVQDFLADQGWDFAFIGGLAVNRWGRARTTNDADICLFTDFGTEDVFVDALLNRFTPRVSEAKDFALRNRVLLLTSANGYGIDISLGAFDFERNAVARSSTFDFAATITLRTV